MEPSPQAVDNLPVDDAGKTGQNPLDADFSRSEPWMANSGGTVFTRRSRLVLSCRGQMAEFMLWQLKHYEPYLHPIHVLSDSQ